MRVDATAAVVALGGRLQSVLQLARETSVLVGEDSEQVSFTKWNQRAGTEDERGGGGGEGGSSVWTVEREKTLRCSVSWRSAFGLFFRLQQLSD